MSILWSYFWPCFAAGLLVGAPIGTIAFRRRSRRNVALTIGVGLSLALAVAFAGFLFGLVLAYLVELRRRHNAQWNW
jgi:membrane associated rhomboid family serine protease